MLEVPATTKDMMKIEIETWSLPSPLKCSESIENFLNWADENGEDIEVHSGWIDKQYTQCEDFIIHPELKGFPGYKSLYPSAVKGDWKKVHNICHEQMFLSTVPITNSWDTVFHLAISDDQKDIFDQLLQLLPQESLRIASALRRKNKKGNNLLHIAASVGSVTMCRRIISISKSMINTYNNEGESPLFVAALHGHKDAFLYLHSECGPDEDYCIRNNGDTILHCAIAEEYYELSCKILDLYVELVDFTNNKCISPLHLLANKPSAFKSGSNLRWFEEIIYHSIIFGTDEQELISEAGKKNLRSEDTHRGSNGALWDQFPPIYTTCFEFVKLVFKAVPSIFRKCTKKKADIENPVRPDVTQGAGDPSPYRVEGHQLQLPPNYRTCFSLVKLVFKAVFLILGAPEMVRKVRTTKVRNECSILIMNKLLKNTSMYQFSKDIPSFSSHYPVIPDHAKSQKDDESPYIIKTKSGKIEKRLLTPSSINVEHRKDTEEPFKSLKPVMPVQGLDNSDQSKAKSIEEEDINLSELTPILVAARNGITEMVETTLRIYPMAMYDVDNKHQKNIVLLTAEHKQPCVYKLLLSLKEEKIIKKSVFCEVDNEGNSALHLAAKSTNFNWPVPGALSQMQWEIKWYEYIQKSLQRNFHFLDNNNSQTPEEIFTKNHQDLVGKGGSWLNNTSNACSVVAGLFVTSTFSTATNLPDAIKNEAYDKASKIYAGSSFVSFYSSLIAVVMFLAIPTSGCRERDFRHALPRKLLLGLTAFYISIASTLVSFTTGHFFIFRDQLKFVSSTSYIVTYALVTVSSMAVFPLYFHLVWATFKKELQRKYRVNIPHWFLED
ncbi:hypothetical protein RGQ29_009088 [Quercus rubra]|uniref:PGG domain-containing protein n=1 Tax=Quercus rubra TaxID=3512 RepID=A0AAN7E364_QUERU|nr:hypothetical protein RGQ29_009088 [Quercus rubra]KAK4560167.1 hypothetical protein RGQ29_009088 [Quercus rubra]